MVTPPKPIRRRLPARRGAALLTCMFIMLVVSTLVMNLLDTELLQFAQTRNTIQYEQALYWANAGVHHACSELANDAAWRGVVSDGNLPPASAPAGYTATASDDGSGGVLIVSTGYSGLGARTVSATLTL